MAWYARTTSSSANIMLAYEGDATPLFTDNETNAARLYGYAE